MPEDLKTRLVAAEIAKQQKEIDEAQVETSRDDDLRTNAKSLEKKMKAAAREAEEAEFEIMAVEKQLSNVGLSAEERATLEQVRAEAQRKVAELDKARSDFDTVQAEIKELNEPAEKDVNIDGKFLGREVKQFE